MTRPTKSTQSPESVHEPEPVGAAEALPPPDPHDCTSWAAGHKVHWVQAMRAGREEGRALDERCTVVDPTDDGWFTVVITDTGERCRYWHHDPDRALLLARSSGLAINRRWWIIRPFHRGSDFVSVRMDRTRCRTDEPSGSPAKQLQTHGGFTVTGDDLARLLEEHRSPS